MVDFNGGCLCGAIRYEVSSEPVSMVNCHCSVCRKATGASFATNIFVKSDDLKIVQGKTNTYLHSADSGNTITKQFCSNCGSQLFNSNAAKPELICIRVGSIDDAGFVNPNANIYTCRALPFTHLSEEIPKFKKMRQG